MPEVPSIEGTSLPLKVQQTTCMTEESQPESSGLAGWGSYPAMSHQRWLHGHGFSCLCIVLSGATVTETLLEKACTGLYRLVS